jgi:hypothetical protein
MKKITLVNSAVVASMILGLSGCGGGGGSSTASTPTNDKSVGTGYYIDKAVSGVIFKCGSQTGTTDKDGKFTFEKGKECSFEVAGIPLRTVPSDKLTDGVKVVEDNTNVARLLQSIDNDGDPDNGIQITDEVVKVLQEAVDEYTKPTKVLEDTTALETVVSKIDQEVTEFEGSVKTDKEVKEHLVKSQTEVTKELLSNKTFYAVTQDNSKWIQETIVFNADATSFTETYSDGNSETVNITINGNRWTGNDDTDGSYTTITSMADYILFDDRYADGSKDGEGHYLFIDETKAQKFLDSKTGGSADSDTITDNKFTTTYLNGKIFYLVTYDDFGYDDIGEKWNMAKMVFTTSSFTWQEYNTPDTNEHTFNYTITDDGKISYVYAEDSSDTGLLSVASVENDYLKVCEDGDCNTYMFFDQADAQAYVTSHNNNSNSHTQSLLVQNPWYVIEYDDNDGTYCAGKFTFGSGFSITVSYIEDEQTQTFNGTYSIDENDALVMAHDGKREVETVTSTTDTSFTTNKITYDEITGDYKHEGPKIYFKNYDDAISFGNSRGVDCSHDIPR